jgi:hypothetical protein
MSIQQKLKAGESSLTEFNGSTPPQMAGSKPLSVLHHDYSINGKPKVVNKPEPSTLDLDGQIPADNYKDNLPEGASI